MRPGYARQSCSIYAVSWPKPVRMVRIHVPGEARLPPPLERQAADETELPAALPAERLDLIRQTKEVAHPGFWQTSPAAVPARTWFAPDLRASLRTQPLSASMWSATSTSRSWERRSAASLAPAIRHRSTNPRNSPLRSPAMRASLRVPITSDNTRRTRCTQFRHATAAAKWTPEHGTTHRNLLMRYTTVVRHRPGQIASRGATVALM